MASAKPLSVWLSARAEEDLEAIWRYTAENWSVAQADRYTDALAAAFDTIGRMPEIARERTEISPPVRLHPSAQHVIIYRIQDHHIEIMRVLGGKQDWLAKLTALDG